MNKATYLDSERWMTVIGKGILLVTLICTTVIYCLYYLKSKVWGLLSGLILGLLSLLIFYNLINNTSFDITSGQGMVDEFKFLFNAPGFIFINLILIMVPVYLILIISSLVFNGSFKDVKKRTYGVSFISLISLSAIGVFIAILTIPLVMLIPEEIWHNALHEHDHDHYLRHGAEGGGFNWMVLLVFGVIIFTFIITIIIRVVISEENVKMVAKSINSILRVITVYFKVVIMLVPLVLFTRLASMGLTTNMAETTAKLQIMGIYVGLFMAGALLIFTLLFASSTLLSSSELSIKERVMILLNYSLISFSNQSAAATLPQTQQTTKDLGVCEEVSSLTPTKGLFMGMIMCNGFTPMLMTIMVLGGGEILSITNVVIAAALIISLSISTSGAGSSDYWITASTLKIMQPYGVTAEIFDLIYLDILIIAQEINEMTVAKPVNGLGHITATLITNKYHMHVSHDEECGCLLHVENESENEKVAEDESDKNLSNTEIKK